MLDEGLCFVCGKPVALNAAYCSQECSAIDSSSSASVSASSSTHPSPLILPSEGGHHSDHDVPPLVRSHHHHHHHHRNKQATSSSSVMNSSEDNLDDNHHPRRTSAGATNAVAPAITSYNYYARRPSATNQRSTIPTLFGPAPVHHRRASSMTLSSELRLASSRHPEDDVDVFLSDLAFPFGGVLTTKALDAFPVFAHQHHRHHREHHQRHTSQFSSSAASSSSSCSSACSSSPYASDEEPGPRDMERYTAHGTITDRHREPPKKKQQHRVSLPAYFSRLSVGASPPKMDLTTAIGHNGHRQGDHYYERASSSEARNGDKSSSSRSDVGERDFEHDASFELPPQLQHTHAQSYPSPKSLSNSHSTPLSAIVATTVTTTTTTTRTPRGRGRGKGVVNVRQGASRSPHGRGSRRSDSRSSWSASWSRSRSRSRSSPLPREVIEGAVFATTTTATTTTGHAQHSHAHALRRGRDPAPRLVPPIDQVPVPVPVQIHEPFIGGPGYANAHAHPSLGERAIRVPDHVHGRAHHSHAHAHVHLHQQLHSALAAEGGSASASAGSGAMGSVPRGRRTRGAAGETDGRH